MATTVITGAQVLVDGEHAPEGVSGIVVVDGRIVETGPGAELLDRWAERDHVDVDHFEGAFLLPGLVDAHVHLTFDATPGVDAATDLTESSAETLAARARVNARAALAAGVTTVRDLGDRSGIVRGLRDEIHAGGTTGPRILTSGVPLTVPGGHLHFLGGAVESDEEIRAAVRQRKDEGDDVIKVAVSGGHITAGSPPTWRSQFTEHQIQVLAQAAREAGLPTAAHAHAVEAIEFAARAGLTTIEHCSAEVAPDPHAGEAAPRTISFTDELVGLIHASGAAVDPTLTSGWIDKAPQDVGFKLIDRIRRLYAAGVPLIVGTDGGVAGSPFGSYAESLLVWLRAGLSNTEVLRLATAETADRIGLKGTTGRLQEGYAADVLIVQSDPRRDLRTVLRPVAVFARGELAGGRVPA
ncbi:amidohydrolase family protein [Brooklawnia cerclae]|uniref:Imidazolonepropionase-like amidohydrolase n=1 Tax=Brooklawnia cerclae TaxID=349934 RepID=A0ABX0SHF0_9ACTN|nr:amidohydrolase family protein [Brooklawnia cerclae]NIH57830.1 imidazolonepropionase-like amidohydrolase [Brooklawnia cerclae]